MAAHPNRRYFILKSIILNNLFGVDIMEEAVEICKLRLFLKLAAQVDPDMKGKNLGIEPLPDIDFNIRAGNTLVGFTSISQVRDAAENEQERDESGLRQSRLLLGDERISRIEQTAADLQQAFDAFRARQAEGDDSVPTEDRQELRQRLDALDDELNRYVATEYGVDPSKRNAYVQWLKSHQPFHWFVEFYGIMSNGGFDVVIGNPPYVEYRLVRDTYCLPKNQYASEPAENLYAFCMERSCSLLRGSGCFGMIVPTGVLGLDETLPLREVLAKRFGSGLLNSTLFFLWFISIGNGRNITGVDVEQMPVGEVDDVLLREASTLFDRLMRDYQNHSFIRERQDCEFQEFRPSMSKAILDELDQLMARHYGFTEEELDFIINYDIKYRMGRNAEESE